MKEIKAILKAASQTDFSKTKAALATVVRVEGSSYRRAGARMLVLENGQYLGGISGGCLEGDALRRAQKAMATGRPSLVTYDTTQDDGHQIGVGLGCNGVIDVLFLPIDQPEGLGLGSNQLLALQKIVETREPRALLTIVSNGEHLGKTFLFEKDGSFSPGIPAEITSPEIWAETKAALETGKPATKTCGNVSCFIEILLPVPNVAILGGNYDIYPLVNLLQELGWNVSVTMNPAKADKSLFSSGVQVFDFRGGDSPKIDNRSAIVLMAHDYRTDLENLHKFLKTNALYIGLLGPKKRGQKMLDELAAAGQEVSETDRGRIFSPAGLDIGAQTPEEIALSIVAEIRAVFAGRCGGALKFRDGSIYA